MLRSGMVLLFVALSLHAEDASNKEMPRIVRPAEMRVGKQIANVDFTDLAGKKHRLSDYQGKRYLVIAYTSTSCPLCKKYAPSLARLEKEYVSKNVTFLFVNPTASDTIKEPGFQGAYVHDRDGKLTNELGTRTTTEVIVLDPTRTIVYRGAVDDQYGIGYSLDAPKQQYLVKALDQLLAGEVPAVAATTAPGCALDVPVQAAKPATRVTYHQQIARLMQAHCVECHRSGGVAPFALDTLKDVVAHKGMIRKVVDKGTMPPWFATAPASGEHSIWSNDRSLPAEDKADLLRWLQGDLAAGDPADAPLPRKFDSNWQIGKPDAVVKFPQAVPIKAEGTMPYQMIVVNTDFDEDKWVQAVEVKPSNREVVHHVIVSVLQPGMSGFERGRDGDGVRTGFFAIYVPGNSQSVFPVGFGKKLPKGSRILFQMHYTPNGKATQDQTELGLIFAKTPPKFEVKVAGVANVRFSIPPEADNHEVDAQIRLPFDATVMGFAPHMHLRGKACKYEITTNTRKTILDIPRYDFNWQLLYHLAEPMPLKKGDTIHYTAWYDNSSKNPANPDPSKTIKWGQQTYDEMMLGYVEYFIPVKQKE